MATAAGASVGFFFGLPGALVGVGCATAAAVLVAWRDDVVARELADLYDPPLAPTRLTRGTVFRQIDGAPEAPAAPRRRPPVAIPLSHEFVRPAPPLTAYLFQEGDAVEFTVSDFAAGDVTYRGTIAHFYSGDRARVDCDHDLSVNVPLAMLTYVGDR